MILAFLVVIDNCAKFRQPCQRNARGSQSWTFPQANAGFTEEIGPIQRDGRTLPWRFKNWWSFGCARNRILEIFAHIELMEDIDWSDRAFYDDGEWVTWTEINEQLQYKEWGAKYPNADRSLIPYFEDLIALAEDYYSATGLHLQAYGDIGELFGAITYGIKLNKTYAKGSDGRLGNDLVEIKTITPFKTHDQVEVKRSGNWSKLLVVKINEEFQVAGRMIDRSQLPKGDGKFVRVRWDDLPSKPAKLFD